MSNKNETYTHTLYTRVRNETSATQQIWFNAKEKYCSNDFYESGGAGGVLRKGPCLNVTFDSETSQQTSTRINYANVENAFPQMSVYNKTLYFLKKISYSSSITLLHFL